jgi:molybdate transport system substrate-binding protein
VETGSGQPSVSMDLRGTAGCRDRRVGTAAATGYNAGAPHPADAGKHPSFTMRGRTGGNLSGRLSRHVVLCLLSVMAVLAAAPAGAADLKVISAGAVRGLIAQIIDDYSRQTGQKFDFTIGTTGQLRNIIASGQPADLVIVSVPLMGELEKTGKLAPGSRADLGRVGIGVTVRDGAAVPDVSTSEALKNALIAARSIAYTDPAEGGTSGIHFAGVADRFGIADAVKGKALLTKGGREAAIEVAEGRAEMAIVFISEAMAVKGVKLAGLLPPAQQDYSAYAAAIPASSTDPAAARAFIAALTSAGMAERWRANGFEPPK